MNKELDHLDVDNQAAPQEPIVTLDFTVNEVNLVLMALQELPHKMSDPILRKIMAKSHAQLSDSSVQAVNNG